MTNTLYAKEDITLASLIPDYRYPNQDAVVAMTVEKDRDFSTYIDKNVQDVFHVASTSPSKLSKLFIKFLHLSPEVKGALSQWRMQAEECRVYMLRQPRAIFKQLCANSAVRQWLECTVMYGEDAYFLVGYRSAVNAKLVHEDLNSSSQRTFDLTGERIYAVCYRKVSFKFMKKVDGAYLGRENCWKLFCEDRGPNEDAFMEVDILDEDENDLDMAADSDSD